MHMYYTCKQVINVNCIIVGNWQLKNSIDDWPVQLPPKLTVGASGCLPSTEFFIHNFFGGTASLGLPFTEFIHR